MYPVFPHASQSSFHPAQLARAGLPYDPAPQAPSAARTPPAVWVLVAMALMALLGGLFATCGLLAATALAAPPEQAAEQAPTAESSGDKQM